MRSSAVNSVPPSLAAPHRGQRRRPTAPDVVKSAVRVLQVLEFFDRKQAPASVGEVATALQFPQSSTSALLRSLVRIGYLGCDARARTYLPTERVPLLGGWVAPHLFRDGRLFGLMNTLAEQFDCAVTLWRRNGDHAQCVHIVDPERVAPPGLALGTLQPLARCTAGLILLATMVDDDVRRLMHRLNAEAPPAGIVRVADLLDRFAALRGRGYALAPEGDHAVFGFRLPQTEASAPPLVLALVADFTVIMDREAAMVAAARQEVTRWLRLPRPRLAAFDVPRALAAQAGHRATHASAA